jgi:hypothetical protein
MSKMWGFFAALQILILITADNFSFSKPANVQTFFEAVKGIINLDALKGALQMVSGPAYNWVEEQDPLLLKTAGVTFVGLVLTLFAVICFLFTAFKRYKYVQDIKQILLWNLLIRFYMISFINLLYQNGFAMTQSPKTVTYVSGSLTILVVLAVWAFTSFYLRKADPEVLDTEDTRQRIGNLYLNLRTQPFRRLFYGQVFFWQRALIIVTVIFVDKQVLQALLLQGLLMAKACYFAAHRPFRSFDEGLSDGLNDIFLVLLHGLQFTISPYVAKDAERFTFGKYFNVGVYTMLALNGLLVVFGIGRSIVASERKKYRKRQA